VSRVKKGKPDGAEARLLQELKAGSQAAFTTAVKQYTGPMLATARAIAGAAQAEDIVQDAWIKIYQQIETFEGRSSLSTWMQRIVANRAISVLRNSGRELTHSDISDAGDVPDWFDHKGEWAAAPPAWHTSSPDALLTADELQLCLDAHLARMPDNQRAVLVMRDMQGLAFEEVGVILEISAANARVLLHRARLRLVDMINRFEETGEC